jgi:hypothetical protein
MLWLEIQREVPCQILEVDRFAVSINTSRLGYAAVGVSETLHELLSVVVLGEVGVMGTAEKADVVDAMVATSPEGPNVVKLEVLGLSTATTVGTDERTSALISFADRSPDGSRDVAGIR